MAVIPHTVDVVVRDMKQSLRFYTILGLIPPEVTEDQPQVQIATPGGFTIGLITEEMLRTAMPDWVQPIGRRITLAFRCDNGEEVDATHEKLVNAGFPSLKAPWDAFWGQHYAQVEDPDGNRIDLFAAISAQGEE